MPKKLFIIRIPNNDEELSTESNEESNPLNFIQNLLDEVNSTQSEQKTESRVSDEGDLVEMHIPNPEGGVTLRYVQRDVANLLEETLTTVTRLRSALSDINKYAFDAYQENS